MKADSNAIYDFGKIQPQAIESEIIVLGTIMNERGAYDVVADILTPECFYRDMHRDIFTAIKTAVESGKFPDMITVVQELSKSGKTEYAYEVAQIAGSVSAEMYQHALVVKEHYIRRKVISLSTTAAQQAFSNSIDIDETINSLVEQIKEVYNETSTGITHISDAVGKMRENVKENISNKRRNSGSMSGFRVLDQKSGGFQGTDLIVIAAESSMGKTSFALSLCNNIAESGNAVAVYSLEMSSVQLAARITAMRTGVPANEILYSKITQEQFERIETSVNRICGLGIYIDERSTSNIDTIISSIRNMKAKYNINGAVVDYLQILNINEKGLNEEAKLGVAARRLKNLAKELNIWIIALSQLNRNESNPYPTLGRLRGSGQIGEASDIVMLIYRPEYYGLSKTYPADFSGYSPEGTALIDVAKGRNIGVFKFLTKFEQSTTFFSEITDLESYRIENNCVSNYEKPF